MKTLTRIFTISVVFFMATSFLIAQSQIQFQGLYSEGEGGAGWDADGSGPEPYGNGHDNVAYYLASRDYVDATSSAGAHMMDNISGFPAFEQALPANGFTANQLTMKMALSNLGDDIEGIDWFTIGSMNYVNYYPVHCTFELDGNLLFEAVGEYSLYTSGPGTRTFQTGYLKINNLAAGGPANVLNVANAFMTDIDDEEIIINTEVSHAADLSGPGRSGSYYDLGISIEKGLPEIPIMGLNADHEGFAGWDADGSGPEPEANGHNTQSYYIASLDYDGIDPDPNACLGHFLEGSTGFLNTLIQLQYRGYEIGDLKLKLGLSSLGPDVEGEDWGNGWSNYYNNLLTIELDGEPILTVLNDTNKIISMGSYWMSNASYGKVYDVSALASPEAQFVAQSFLKDMGTHFLRTNTNEVHDAGQLNSSNGRDGSIYEITAGAIVGIHAPATFIPEGEVSGTWSIENSPYCVDGHLTVENGQTLTIEPGVKVAVRGPYHFNVQGNIKALGASDNNIIFSSSNPNLYWDGFDFDEPPPTSDARFDWCLFQYGCAQGEGEALNSGGIFAVKDFDSLTILNSTFRHNLADIDGNRPPSGGAIALWNASPMIQKCTFYDNYAEYGGALLCYEGSDATISNNLFYDNTAETDAGALEIWESSPTIINNTFSLNRADNYGGAVDVYDTSDPVFVNNIFWGNTALTGGQQISVLSADCNISITYCDVEGGEAGIGPNGIQNGTYENNIDEDPAFLGTGEFPYALEETSACVDAGWPADWFMIADFDIIGNQRVLDGNGDGTKVADMGAYEYVSNSDWIITEGNSNATNLNSSIKCFPNPFKTHATIIYELNQSSYISLKIQKLNGQDIISLEDTYQESGYHKLLIDGSVLGPGIYVCILKTNAGTESFKLIKL